MAGETDLATLLRNLHPALDERDFAFGFVPPGVSVPDVDSIVGTFRETEGMTVIALTNDLGNAGIVHTPGWAKITLEVHSALSAVGLTAAIATALAKSGISANVVAAYHHDHIFIPWGRRHEAMEVLTKLSAQSE